MYKVMKKMKNIKKVILTSFLLAFIFACSTQQAPSEKKLPIVGEYDVVYKTINGKEVADTIWHVVPSFKYLNQDSNWINSTDIKDKIWVADFFFTSCPSICPPMTSNMKLLSENLEDLSKELQFLSFSIDPKTDTPNRLRSYIIERELTAKNWYFFTGDEEATHLLAKEFFNGAERDEDAAGGFGHTPYFALVDTKGHVRGIYDGTDPIAVKQLEEDIRLLIRTEYHAKN
jgi:protein SCO1